MTTLKDPLRFASFAEGGSHLEDSEVQLFQNSKSSESENDDEEARNGREEQNASLDQDLPRRNSRHTPIRERAIPPTANDLRMRIRPPVFQPALINPEISDDEN